jgi:hypothetical protein
MRQLLIESGEINERIMCGDICSAKTGLPRARKLCEKYKKILVAEKCDDVKIEPFVAYGGWIGITYGYVAGDDPVVGSAVVRTLA